jgi:hypothetical protein
MKTAKVKYGFERQTYLNNAWLRLLGSTLLIFIVKLFPRP